MNNCDLCGKEGLTEFTVKSKHLRWILSEDLQKLDTYKNNWLTKNICEDCFKKIFEKSEGNHTIEQNAGDNQIEGGVVSIGGSVDIPDNIKRECRTCKNPYCSRTLEERQKVEVQVHTQYGWECCDKEKYLQNDGGYVLVKKEEFEKAVKSFTPKNKVVDAMAYAIYYTANPDSKMCVPNCAYIQAEKMFEKWKEEQK